MENRFNERYKTGDLPWNLGKPDLHLINTVTHRMIPKGKALDVGCGTGDNAIWLAQQVFLIPKIGFRPKPGFV